MDIERELGCDVLVVGGGPGGRAAARAARRGGADVVVLDEGVGDFAWGAFSVDEIGAVMGGVAVVIRPRRVVLAVPPVVLAGGVRVAETGLARALGAAQRAVGPGLMETVVDREGRTGVAGVFSVAGTGCDAVARAQGRRAGRAAAVEVAGGVFGSRGAAVAVRRRGLRAGDVAGFSDSAVVCGCEGVTAGAIRAARGHGAVSLGAVKRATRAGMGRCQGRLCVPTLLAFCGDVGEGEVRALAPRAPVRPVRIGVLMRAMPEPVDAPVAAPAFNRWVAGVPVAVPATCDVVVIGGGVIGLSAARDLAAAGRDVVLLERGEPGLGASTANAGSLHVQLVPYVFRDGAPGPLAEALALGPRSIVIWREIADQVGETLGIRTEGGLVLAATEEELAWLGRKAAFERSRGVETVILGGAEVARLAPALAPCAGAAFCAAEGQIDPLRGTLALHRLAVAAGVRVVSGVAVMGLAAEGAGWRVETAGGVVRAGQVLNAAGAHAGVVGRLAGVALPVGAVVQQVIATGAGAPVLRQLVAQVRQHLSLKQGDGGHVLIGGGWPGRLDADGATRLLRRSVQGNLAVAVGVMPGLAGMEAVRAWTGLTVHLEGGPVVSGTPGMGGLFHAVTTNGYTLGPVVGRIVAEGMLGRGALPGGFGLG